MSCAHVVRTKRHPLPQVALCKVARLLVVGVRVDEPLPDLPGGAYWCQTCRRIHDRQHQALVRAVANSQRKRRSPWPEGVDGRTVRKPKPRGWARNTPPLVEWEQTQAGAYRYGEAEAVPEGGGYRLRVGERGGGWHETAQELVNAAERMTEASGSESLEGSSRVSS